MISFSTDSYFHIGEAHLGAGKPCQDYATSGQCKEAVYAIVSDGCSTGGATDVGSRILALSTATALENYVKTVADIDALRLTHEVGIEQRLISKSVRASLGIETKDMFATCVYVVANKSGATIFIQGDGVVAIKTRNGDLRANNFEWEGNMPFYPAYAELDMEGFFDAHGGDPDAKRLTSIMKYISDKKEEIVERNEYSVTEGVKGVTICISEETLKEIEFIAVFSDGVTQIDGLEWIRAVKEFMNFKNTKGEFAKRRMIRGIKDSYRFGKGPFDDISYAVIYVQHNEEES